MENWKMSTIYQKYWPVATANAFYRNCKLLTCFFALCTTNHKYWHVAPLSLNYITMQQITMTVSTRTIFRMQFFNH